MAIDGYTQPGSSTNTNGPGLGLNTVLKIELNGINAGAFVDGLVITAGNSTVRGMVINRFGIDANGIRLQTNGGNVIEGNFIGTDVTGSVDLGNGQDGVNVGFAASNNIIGGTAPSARNLISGNSNGVGIFGFGATGNVVQGNLIGTDVTGTAALGNTRGVWVSYALNTIGGLTPGTGNVISGNIGDGVSIFGIDATGSVVQGNYIGTDVTGTVDLGNGGSGVVLERSPNNSIGGTEPGAANLLSSNDGAGVALFIGATGNQVLGNLIGTDVNGITALGNKHGIEIHPSNNTIGGTVAGARNVISGNILYGVYIISPGSTGNAILGNPIFSNGDLGIALGGDWVTPNDPDDVDTGANNLQNFPELTAATTRSTTVDGTLNSTASTLFRLEFFSNTACDALGNGEGESFLGFSDQATDGTGNVSFSVTFPDTVLPGLFITATATDPNNNTSEFSQCFEVAGVILATAAPTLVSEVDVDGAAGVEAAIQQVYDSNTLAPLPGVLIGSYQASLSYNGTLLEVLDARLKAPFDTGNVAIDNLAGLTTFDASAVGGAPWPVDPLAFAVLRLTGCVTDPVTLTPSFDQVLDDGGNPLAVGPLTAKTLRRGDVRAGGTINISDALFGAQYLAGLRALGEDIDSVHAVNAAGVKQDGAFDVINIADVLFIAQQLVGLRNDCFDLPAPPPPPPPPPTPPPEGTLKIMLPSLNNLSTAGLPFNSPGASRREVVHYTFDTLSGPRLRVPWPPGWWKAGRSRRTGPAIPCTYGRAYSSTPTGAIGERSPPKT